MKMQPSESRKTFRFGSYLHQSQVLCSTFIPGAPHLGCSKPFYPLCMVDRLSPNSTGQFLGLFPPSLTPSAQTFLISRICPKSHSRTASGLHAPPWGTPTHQAVLG